MESPCTNKRSALSTWEWRPSKRFKQDTSDDEYELMEKDCSTFNDALTQLEFMSQ